MASFCDACRQQTSKHPKRDVSMCAAIMYTVLSIVYQSIAGHVTAAKKTTPTAHRRYERVSPEFKRRSADRGEDLVSVRGQ